MRSGEEEEKKVEPVAASPASEQVANPAGVIVPQAPPPPAEPTPVPAEAPSTTSTPEPEVNAPVTPAPPPEPSVAEVSAPPTNPPSSPETTAVPETTPSSTTAPTPESPVSSPAEAEVVSPPTSSTADHPPAAPASASTEEAKPEEQGKELKKDEEQVESSMDVSSQTPETKVEEEPKVAVPPKQYSNNFAYYRTTEKIDFYRTGISRIEEADNHLKELLKEKKDFRAIESAQRELDLRKKDHERMWEGLAQSEKNALEGERKKNETMLASTQSAEATHTVVNEMKAAQAEPDYKSRETENVIPGKVIDAWADLDQAYLDYIKTGDNFGGSEILTGVQEERVDTNRALLMAKLEAFHKERQTSGIDLADMDASHRRIVDFAAAQVAKDQETIAYNKAADERQAERRRVQAAKEAEKKAQETVKPPIDNKQASTADTVSTVADANSSTSAPAQELKTEVTAPTVEVQQDTSPPTVSSVEEKVQDVDKPPEDNKSALQQGELKAEVPATTAETQVQPDNTANAEVSPRAESTSTPAPVVKTPEIKKEDQFYLDLAGALESLETKLKTHPDGMEGEGWFSRQQQNTRNTINGNIAFITGETGQGLAKEFKDMDLATVQRLTGDVIERTEQLCTNAESRAIYESELTTLRQMQAQMRAGKEKISQSYPFDALAQEKAQEEKAKETKLAAEQKAAAEAKSREDIAQERARKAQEAVDATARIEREKAAAIQVVSAAPTDKKEAEKIAETKKDEWHPYEVKAELYEFKVKREDGKLNFECTKIPNTTPAANGAPNADCIAFVQAQLKAMENEFGKGKFVVDILTTDEHLKQAYILVCQANNVECSVGGVVQQPKDTEKEIVSNIKEKIKPSIEQLESTVTKLENNIKAKTPLTAENLIELNNARKELKEFFKEKKPESMKQEIQVETLIRRANRLETADKGLKQAEANKAAAEIEAKKVAASVIDPDSEREHGIRMVK